MQKLYTEEQYKEYLSLSEKMANNNDIFSGVDIHFEIKEWLKNNNISKEAENQMDDRMERECNEEMKGEI